MSPRPGRARSPHPRAADERSFTCTPTMRSPWARMSANAWGDRALPGRGDMDLTEILKVVRASGFSGWYELEIFSDDGTLGTAYADSLWKWPPRDLLRAGRDGFAQAWRSSVEAGR